MDKIILNANTRTSVNKSSRNSLRRDGRVPGVFYSKHDKPMSIDVTEKAIKPLVFTSETHLIGLTVDGSEHDCVIKDVQFDPVTDRIIHFDLLGLTSNEMFQLEVPVQFLGNAVGIKEGGILQQTLHKLQIECLPKDIPQHLEIDVTNLKLGDAIHAGDLKYEGITILTQADAVVVAVTHPKVEKEATAEAGAASAEPEVITKGKAEEE
jgi:large subunit ribosomal protein L25